MRFDDRVAVHAALGDPVRLRIVDALSGGDLTPGELAERTGAGSNLLAHHLGVLAAAGLVQRRTSEGDARRKYVMLRSGVLDDLAAVHGLPPPARGSVLFVCTRNSARSQFAAAYWTAVTGQAAESAGRAPAERIHPRAVEVAGELGVALGDRRPRGYEDVEHLPDLVVSVCDQARETAIPFTAPLVHWSIPDPVRAGSLAAFRTAFAAIADRVGRWAERVPA